MVELMDDDALGKNIDGQGERLSQILRSLGNATPGKSEPKSNKCMIN